MPKLQLRTIEVAEAAFGIAVASGTAPEWLSRPGRSECGPLWPAISAIYAALADGLVLPDTMPARERRAVDGVVTDDAGTAHILEVDEKQHFNAYRYASLEVYPRDTELRFPLDSWREASSRKTRLEGGGFARPRPPLFGMENGRHRQRAFRDALADLLPPHHGWGPTIRIAHFELEPWIWRDDAPAEFGRRFASRFGHQPAGARQTVYARQQTIRRQPSADRGSALTQQVTPVDLAHGRIRIPAATKPMFPSIKARIDVRLRGVNFTVAYDPRNGPDRPRSGVLQIGRGVLRELVEPSERLSVSTEGEVFVLTELLTNTAHPTSSLRARSRSR